MRSFTLPLILAASFGLTTPVAAQTDLEDILGGIAQTLLQQELDRTAYIAAQEANTVAAYRDYLAKFPKGTYRSNAEKALARLGAPVDGSVDAAAQAEARLGITIAQRVAVQQKLTQLGYRTYGADGVWGRNTRNAIATWQRDRGEKVTGYVTEAQLRLLLKGSVVVPPDDDTPPATLTASQAEARLGITRAQRVAVQQKLTQLGYRTYGADGVWGRNTRNAIATWQRDRGEKVTGYVTEAQLRLLLKGSVVAPPDDDTPPATLTAAQTEAALRLTRAQRTEIQRQLTALGYNAGVADGLWGSRTRTAITAWQKANRKAQTGYVTAAEVKLIAAQAAKVAPAPVEDNAAALEESFLLLTLAERADLQRRLTQLGYDPLRTDGTFGAGTRRAISEWQRDEGLAVTGYLTADQVRLIRVETGG